MTAREPDQVIPFDRLPDRFAERVARPPERPVQPRPAATIVLLRDGDAGLEVLLMRRSRQAGFVPGAYVFPGGRVDAADGDPRLVSLLDGLDPVEAAERLALADGDPPAIAYYLAALREAFEETGILVGVRPDGSAPSTAAEDPGVDLVRQAVMDDELDFADAVSRLGCRIAGDAIEYLAHWITPTPEPRRYDTRFFAAKVAPDSPATVDPREMTDAVWATPPDALRRVDAGSMPMVFPTIRTLEQLAPYSAADQALAALGRTPVRTILPTLVVTRGGIGMRVDYVD